MTTSAFCRFGSAAPAAPAAQVLSSWNIVCITPAVVSAGSLALVVTATDPAPASGGFVAASEVTPSGAAVSFEFADVEVATSATAQRAPNGQFLVTVHGLHFLPRASLSCRIDGQIVPAEFVSPTKLVCLPPLGSQLRPRQVAVSNNGADFSFPPVIVSWAGNSQNRAFVSHADPPLLHAHALGLVPSWLPQGSVPAAGPGTPVIRLTGVRMNGSLAGASCLFSWSGLSHASTANVLSTSQAHCRLPGALAEAILSEAAAEPESFVSSSPIVVAVSNDGADPYPALDNSNGLPVGAASVVIVATPRAHA